MNAPASSPLAPGRCKRLKAASSRDHDTVDQLVMSVRPFEDLTRYTRFLTVQHRFHGSLLPLYRDPALNHHLPGLHLLSRFDAVQQDLRDLGMTVPPAPEPVDVTFAQALGWLYCSEGSNLGAAFLFKQTRRLDLDAERGARHLAPHPDGRALHWRDFVARLDAVDLSDTQEAHAIEGAIAAFDQYRRHVREVFELQTAMA